MNDNQNVDNNTLHVYIDGCTIHHKTNNTRLYAGYGICFPNKEFDNISDPFLIEPITEERAKLYAVYNVISKFVTLDKNILDKNILDKNILNKNILNISINSEYCVKCLKIGKLINRYKNNKDLIKLIFDLIEKNSDKQIIFNNLDIDNLDIHNLNVNSVPNLLALDGANKSMNFFMGIDKKRKKRETEIITNTSIEKYTYDNDNKEYFPSDIKIVRKQRKKKIIIDI
ncbi:MAG: hypothetical protein Homavirus28_4 [Homavirus sp.]|uniref:RNase H type-1 domain-containing protein n=1 Tax=Homavirus sp. TaxID=2487769 RepID=A0A3G5A540_9VIRU|nr:MAG: hypothetical protein Homavirus28_4 [Homavirus sp.]